MPPYFPRWLTKCFLALNTVNLILNLLLFIWADPTVKPGNLSSAFGGGTAATWMAMLGQYRRDSQITLLSVPFVAILLLALFGFTSYLCSALVSAAFIYLFWSDLHAAKS